MKQKNIVGCLCLMLLLCLVLGIGYNQKIQNEKVSYENGIGTYQDGIISFSWNVDQYEFAYLKRKPVLYRKERKEGERIWFSVMETRDGFPSDMTEALFEKMFETYAWSDGPFTTTATFMSDMYEDRNYITLFSGMIDTQQEHFLQALITSDGKHMAMITMGTDCDTANFDALFDSWKETDFYRLEFEKVLDSIQFSR